MPLYFDRFPDPRRSFPQSTNPVFYFRVIQKRIKLICYFHAGMHGIQAIRLEISHALSMVQPKMNMTMPEFMRRMILQPAFEQPLIKIFMRQVFPQAMWIT
jgi:hypothetical protein